MPDVGSMRLAALQQGMSDQQKMLLVSEYNAVKKDRSTALIFSLFLGGHGVDRFYLGDTWLGAAKLLTVGGLGVWTMVDWFLIQGRADEVNYEKAREIAFAIAPDTVRLAETSAPSPFSPRGGQFPVPVSAAPGSQPASRSALLVAAQAGREVYRMPLSPGASCTIGRDAGSNIVLQDPKASGNHAVIEALPDGGVSLRDLGSTNGTFVGESRITGTVRIQPGTEARFGGTILSFAW